MKDRTTAILLALLLGGIGAHQFYLGNNLKGIFYLLFCWTLIPVFIAIIDIIILITTSDQIFNLRYNTNVNTNQVNATPINAQKEYNDYVKYTKEIDLNYIQNNEHGTGSYNEALKNLINDYNYLSNIPVNQIKSDEIFLRFKRNENHVNTQNKLIGYPTVNYWDYLSAHLAN